MKTRSHMWLTVFMLWCLFEIVFAESSTTLMLEEKQVHANAATQEECQESTSGVFLIILLTLIVVFAAELFVFIFWKYYWKLKHGTHLVLITDIEKGELEFAFDNPGFKEGTPVIRAKKQMFVEKVPHNEFNNVQQLSNGHKPQSLDKCLNKSGSDTKTNVVPLRSKDFTGLGFNVCGNMRDGIYVKDVLHHGPASETGKIKAGDRISAIRINFSHMVYEDAMAILSYASPYDVEIEVENSSMSPDLLKNRNLNDHIHSFYRSQSSSAAKHIQKVIPRKLNFNEAATQVKAQSTDANKIAVLEVSQESQVSDKVFKFGGIRKVLPDIQVQSTTAKSLPMESAEKQQNATTMDLERNSGINTKTPTSFDEVDLSSPFTNQPVEKISSLASTFKDSNVKKALVKGIKNLKEKLNHVQKSNNTKENHQEQTNDDLEQVFNDEKLENCVRVRSVSESSGTDEASQKNSKRNAPLPPLPVVKAVKMASEFNLLNEIENEVNTHNYENKNDSKAEDESQSNTVELNSSHITVHHVPQETNRKAASLEDLTIVSNDLSSVQLEDAMSFALADHTPPSSSKKRKTPMPLEEMTEDTPFKETKLETMTSSKLEKSYIFGTLEEAIHSSSSDQDLNGDTSLLSTPMKLNDELFPVVDSMTNISWELHFDLKDDDKDDVFLVDEKVPDLPTSPLPNLPSYVTEIKVSNEHENDLSNMNSSDLTLFTTADEVSTDFKDCTNETRHVENGSQESTSPTSADKLEKASKATESEKSSIDTMEEVTCNGTIQEKHKTGVKETKSKKVPANVKKLAEMNLVEDHFTTINLCTPRYRTINTNSSPTSKKSLPCSSTKLPKLSQSVSLVRAVGSRIPVRANTEPFLKVSSINRDELAKNRKCKLSDDTIENGTLTSFTSNSHLPSAVHKSSVLAESRHNGPNR